MFMRLFKENWKSGLTIALISMPLSISLAVASGVCPTAGIITAIWAGLMGGIFGGSNYNIIGPTGALSGLIASYALMYGPETVSSLAIVTGLFVFLAYVLRLEQYLVFIPSSVIHGFTLGVAFIIGFNQLNFGLGLTNLPKHEKLFDNILESFKHVSHFSYNAVILFFVFLCALFVLRKIMPRIPGIILLSPFGILVGYLAHKDSFFGALETLGMRCGVLSLQFIQVPTITFQKSLLVPGMVVALVALIETMLSAKIADAVTKTRFHPRKEMIGLGIANLVSGLAGGMPATAALARTSFNIKSGATNKLSAVLNSIFIALGALFLLPYFNFMPMAVIAAFLVYVAINMIERQHFVRLFEHDRISFGIALIVACITVYEDPIIGILCGSVISLLLLVKKISSSAYEVKEEMISDDHRVTRDKKGWLTYIPKGKMVYINSQAHLVRFQTDFSKYAGIIISLEDVYFIDMDGVEVIDEIIDIVRNRGQLLAIVCSRTSLKNMLQASTNYEELAQSGLIFNSVADAYAFFSRKR